MPQFTFEGPDGQRHTVEGPQGATHEDAFKILQGQIGAAPASNDYHSQLSGALNAAIKALAPSWNHNDPSYSPFKPAQPGNMPNDAINPVGTDAQMAAAIPGAKVARMMAQGPPTRLQPAPPQPPPSFGSQMAQNVQPGATPVQQAGNGLQAQLLNAAKQHGGELAAHAFGGPIAGAAARFAPQVLRLMKG